MSALNIPEQLIQSIGWTLIHSIWQAFTIYCVLKFMTRFVPARRSVLRYALGVGSLLIMLVSAATTFLVLNGGASEQVSFQNFGIAFNTTSSTHITASIFTQALHWIDANIIWLFRFWILGFMIGMCRIAAGLWYIDHLRKRSHPVQEEWMSIVGKLSESLKIKTAVTMAEAAVSSPMVVGFLKPVILFPIGMLAGLSVEQVETILVHELAHIRRQDYIINLFQSIVETIFFFNPFVLMISSLIREERENCCDDMVIARGISPITYVRTLAQLEGARSSSTLALGIASNKNQLLNRIKRIMENSAKNEWGKGRLVPIALLFLGFVCASWLSIGNEAETSNTRRLNYYHAISDTSKKDKPVQSNKSDLSNIPEPEEPWETSEPDLVEIPGFPEEAFIYMPHDYLKTYRPDIHAFEPFNDSDSIPGIRFRSYSDEEWARLESEFRKKFEQQFKDFYSKNQQQFDKMMDELRKEQSEAAAIVDLDQMERFRHLSEMQADKMLHLSDDFGNVMQLTPDKIELMKDLGEEPDDYAYTFQFKDKESLELLKGKILELDQLGDLKVDGKELNLDNLKLLNEQLDLYKDEWMGMAANSDAYAKELEEQLIKDGYIKKGEGLGQVSIADNGKKMNINGVDIKEKDIPRYRELHSKYFKQRFERKSYGRPE